MSMENLNNYLKALTGKNEALAEDAASYMINNADKELYKMLVEKSDFLFDFIRNNVIKRIDKAVNKNNFKNLIKFFDIYSPYYDDIIAQLLAKHANQDLTDEIFEFLEKGTTAQKTYSAKYFSYIPDTVALEFLSKYAFSDDEFLSFNSAEALGQMRDDVSFDIALNYLSSDDDFEKLKAVKFFNAYGQNYPFEEIFKAMKSSKMPENIAGQIPYMESLLSLIKSKYKSSALEVVDNIISGFGEILPLSDIFQFEMYEVLEFLIKENQTKNENSGKIAEILLNAYSKFNLFCENQEYIFDEDNDTKYEITSVYNLLKAQNANFWSSQKVYLTDELSKSNDRVICALHVIQEFNLTDTIPSVKNLLNSNNEILICETLTTLKALNAINDIDFNSILSKIENENIKAVIENIRNQ